MLPSADLHVGDLHFGELLAMPGFAAIPGAAGETENAHLLVLAVAHDLRRHLGALYRRLAGRDVRTVAREQHLVEGDLGAGLGLEQRHADNQTRLGLELLATGGENGVGHGSGTLMVPWVSAKPPHIVRSRPARPASPSSGTPPGASSGRRAPRARGPSPSPTCARTQSPVLRGTAPLRDAAAPPVSAPDGSRRRAP